MTLGKPYRSILTHGPFIGEFMGIVPFIGSNTSTTLQEYPEKVTAKEALDTLKALTQPPIRGLWLGGGEPLLQPDIVFDLAVASTVPVYLETNGTLSNAMSDLQKLGDTSTLLSNIILHHDEEFERENIEFLGECKDLPVHMIYKIPSHFVFDPFWTLLLRLEQFFPDIHFVIQPIPSFSGEKHVTKGPDLSRIFKAAQKKLKHIKIVPPVHQLMDVSGCM